MKRVIFVGEVGSFVDDFYKFAARSISRSKVPFDVIFLHGAIDLSGLDNLTKSLSKSEDPPAPLAIKCVLLDPALRKSALMGRAKDLLSQIFIDVHVCDPTEPGLSLPCGCVLTRPKLPNNLFSLVWMLPGLHCDTSTSCPSLSGSDIQRLVGFLPDSSNLDFLFASNWPTGIVDAAESVDASNFVEACRNLRPELVPSSEVDCVRDVESFLKPHYTIANGLGIHHKVEIGPTRPSFFAGLAHLGWRSVPSEEAPVAPDSTWSLSPLWARTVKATAVTRGASRSTATITISPIATSKRPPVDPIPSAVNVKRPRQEGGQSTNQFGLDESPGQPIYHRFMDPVGKGVLSPNQDPNGPNMRRAHNQGPIRTSQGPTNPPSAVLFISNLPHGKSDWDICDALRTKIPAEIKDVRFGSSTEEFRRGRCWTEFNSVQDAERILSTMTNTLEIEGRMMFMDFGKGSRHPTSSDPNGAEPLHMDIKSNPDCWFCLANPTVERSLIVSTPPPPAIHYTSLAKGGFNDAHLLVSPLTHYPSSALCPTEVSTKLAGAAMDVKKAMREAGYRYTYLWERYFPMRNTAAMHMQIQIVGLRTPLITPFTAAVANLENDCGLHFEYLNDDRGLTIVRDRVAELEDSFTYIEYESLKCDDSSNNSITSQAVLCVRKKNERGPRMPINLGRELLCSATGSINLVNWKDCVLPDDRTKQIKERWTHALSN